MCICVHDYVFVVKIERWNGATRTKESAHRSICRPTWWGIVIEYIWCSRAVWAWGACPVEGVGGASSLWQPTRLLTWSQAWISSSFGSCSSSPLYFGKFCAIGARLFVCWPHHHWHTIETVSRESGSSRADSLGVACRVNITITAPILTIWGVILLCDVDDLNVL